MRGFFYAAEFFTGLFGGTMKLYLIRHAESIANMQGIYQGQTYNTGLSPLGKKQAEALKDQLRQKNIEAIYSSPSRRCLETVKPLSITRGLKIYQDKNLLEINHGDWEGKTKEYIKKLFPRQLKCWKVKPTEVQMPNGENIFEVKKRIEKILDELKENYREKTLLVCTHDAVIRTFLAPLLNLPLDDIFKINLATAAITTAVWTSPWSIVELNDKGHLKGALADISRHAL